MERKSMARVTQHHCNTIARTLNDRPRKRYDFDTPEQRFQLA
jgi:IS30 family transposase